jgi:peptidoglycan hydrolase-like protein with peptidoglycan-binding domain
VRRGVAVMAVAALALICADAASASVSVTVDRIGVATGLGKRFAFRSTVVNTGPGEARGLVAHLNVASLRPGVYVDPEDWSTSRTRYLDPIPAGGRATVRWSLQAVNAGSFAVYVAVLPARAAGRPPTVGRTVQVTVAERRTLDAGGILPLALGVPAVLGLAAGGLALRRRRLVSAV